VYQNKKINKTNLKMIYCVWNHFSFVKYLLKDIEKTIKIFGPVLSQPRFILEFI